MPIHTRPVQRRVARLIPLVHESRGALVDDGRTQVCSDAVGVRWRGGEEGEEIGQHGEVGVGGYVVEWGIAGAGEVCVWVWDLAGGRRDVDAGGEQG